MVMLEAFGKGILAGFFLSLLIGPVFFALIQASINKGFKAGAGMAVGIALSDIFYVFLASLGVSYLVGQAKFQTWLGWSGGLVMLAFGLLNLIRKPVQPVASEEPLATSNVFKQMLNGFMLNGINPFVLLFWFSLASLASLEFTDTAELKVIFFASILLTVFLIDLLKAFLADRLRRFISLSFMRWMNRVVGIVLLLFGLRLFWFAYESSFARELPTLKGDLIRENVVQEGSFQKDPAQKE